jgi:hypothetical protein
MSGIPLMRADVESRLPFRRRVKAEPPTIGG